MKVSFIESNAYIKIIKYNIIKMKQGDIKKIQVGYDE